MNYGVRLYINSGFNSVNIPDNPTLLDGQNNYIDVPALDILQDRNLSVIRVKVTWDNVKDTDYLRLTKIGSQETWFYSVDDIIMENTDTASLSVTPDYINSIGGVSNIQVLDGITERVHVADDSYGLYTSEDELLTPEEPLKIDTSWEMFDTNSGDVAIFVESTVNPIVTDKIKSSNIYTGETTDNETYSVSVPRPVENEHETGYSLEYTGTPSDPNSNHTGTCLYLVNNEYNTDVKDGISSLRGLGLEQSIIKQFAIPNSLIEYTNLTDISKYTVPTQSGTPLGVTYSYVDSVKGKKINRNLSGNKFKYVIYPNVKNNRINYSDFMKYGIMSCTGESVEFSPRQIYNFGGDEDLSPTIMCVVDPHPDGKPYFRFKWLDGVAPVFNSVVFWRNCISGMPWKEVPLIYSGASGSILNTLRTKANFEIENVDFQAKQRLNQDMALRNFSDMAFGAMNTALGVGVAMSTSGLTGGASIIGGLHNISNSVIDLAQLEHQFGFNKQLMASKRKSELLDLEINNNVVAPTVAFPFNSDVIRDFHGNNILAYRYYYANDDVQRIDKLLTMFGYKHCKALETSDFNNRQYFNYVRCSNISVTGNARYINEGIADQLNGGVRIWHVKPNKTYYNNNPIRNNS